MLRRVLPCRLFISQIRAAGTSTSGGTTERFTPSDIDASLLNHQFWSDDGLPYNFGFGDEGDEFSPDTLEFIPDSDKDILGTERAAKGSAP